MEAFNALRDKMIDGHTQLKQLNMQQRAKDRTLKECELVAEQLEPLPITVRTFTSIGRAYLLSSKDDIVKGLKEKAEKCKSEAETLKTGQTKVEGELKEIEQNLQELLKSSPDLLAQMAPVAPGS